jgi:hypothetical protein
MDMAMNVINRLTLRHLATSAASIPAMDWASIKGDRTAALRDGLA